MASSGEKAWEFNTIKNDPKSWGGDSGKFRRRRRLDDRLLRSHLESRVLGHGEPGAGTTTGAARGPATTLTPRRSSPSTRTTASSSGTSRRFPHDDWDYDAGLGESLVLDRDGKKLLVHQNKSGFVFVYDRTNGKIQNVWQ